MESQAAHPGTLLSKHAVLFPSPSPIPTAASCDHPNKLLALKSCFRVCWAGGGGEANGNRFLVCKGGIQARILAIICEDTRTEIPESLSFPPSWSPFPWLVEAVETRRSSYRAERRSRAEGFLGLTGRDPEGLWDPRPDPQSISSVALHSLRGPRLQLEMGNEVAL